MVAIKRKPLPLHLQIQRHRANPVGLIRSSYRENGKVKHSTHGRITGLSLEQLQLLQAAFRGDVVPKGSAEDFQIRASRNKEPVELQELARNLDWTALFTRAKNPGFRIPADERKIFYGNNWHDQPVEKHRSVGTVRRERQSRCRPPLLSADGSAPGMKLH